MDALAHKALLGLLRAADRIEAGTTTRKPSLTTRQLAPYRELRSLKDKEAFEDVLKHAEAVGAIRLTRPRFHPDGAIERVDLVDAKSLAAVLGDQTLAQRVEHAKRILRERTEAFPVLEEVLEKWGQLKHARRMKPEDAALWLDACEVVAYCREVVADGTLETAVRDASARLFRDSKRIEQLVAPLDVLLSGTLDGAARTAEAVLQELGLFREEQPARLAGNVVVRRERGAFVLDRPYGALPPSTVLGLGSIPSMVQTIENQTTFHVEARRRCDSDVLCIYTAGMPSPAWRRMYVTLLQDLPPGTPVQHWGDVDEGGFRIAAFLARAAAEAGKTLEPWNMHPDDVQSTQRRAASGRVVERMVAFAREAGWPHLADAITLARFVAEQEG